MDRFWKRISQSAGALAAAWVVLAFIAALVKTPNCIGPCSDAWARAIWNAFSDFILLRWLMEWQALVSGILALAAAGVGAYYLQRQIKQAQEFRAKDRGRRLSAARAVTPMLLSELLDYALTCGRMLLTLHRKSLSDTAITACEVEFPRTPPDLVPTFQKLISLSEDDEEVSGIIELLKWQQILMARLDSSQKARTADGTLQGLSYYNMTTYLGDACRVYGFASIFLQWARREIDIIPPEPRSEDIYTGLRLALQFSDPPDDVLKHFEWRFGMDPHGRF